MTASRRPSVASGGSRRQKQLNPVSEWSVIRPDVDRVDPRFVGCSAQGCSITSATGEYNAMTLRTGFSNCCKHLDPAEIENKITESIRSINTDRVTTIFYDIELSKDGQIEQLSALTDSGSSFSLFIRTAVRTNTSPNLKQIPPLVYSALAYEPKDAMESFIRWIKLQHSMNTNGSSDLGGVVLTAHFGSCHDHVYLLRTMMSWGITPPPCRLGDTLALFKSMKGMNQRANLATLITTYTPWIRHLPHDADSDVKALRAVVMTAYPNVRLATYTFSCTYQVFIERTGLNMHGIRPVYAFGGNEDSRTDPGLDFDSESSSASSELG
jgi:hypothetical protein